LSNAASSIIDTNKSGHKHQHVLWYYIPTPSQIMGYYIPTGWSYHTGIQTRMGGSSAILNFSGVLLNLPIVSPIMPLFSSLIPPGVG
jgi:hypothetical protein